MNLNRGKFNTNIYLLETKKIIFIYGGSQGSIPLIDKFLLILDKLDKNLLNDLKLIIQAPKIFYNDLNVRLNSLKIDFEINEFYKNIDQILTISNLAITRAGSGTINDLIKFNTPSIIIPLPHSMNNHQFNNAKYLSDKNCAILFDENNFNTDINTNIFKNLITNELQLNVMKKELNKIILPEANKLMLKKLF